MRDESGRPSALVGFMDDVTERRLTEDLIRRELARRAARVGELEERLDRRTLAEFLPMCMYCRKIRDDDGRWQRLEEYLLAHTGTSISHGLCPDCTAKFDAGFEDDGRH